MGVGDGEAVAFADGVKLFPEAIDEPVNEFSPFVELPLTLGDRPPM